MDYTEDSIYYSDEESIGDDDNTPVCVGCQCEQKTCENLMPTTGTVLWGSTEWEVQDYIHLNARLLTIGVRLHFQCLRCIQCELCVPGTKIFYRSVEYEERKQLKYEARSPNSMPCASKRQVGCLMSIWVTLFSATYEF